MPLSSMRGVFGCICRQPPTRAKVIDRLARDLRAAFPKMREFAQAWPDDEFVQQAAAQLPRFHLGTLRAKLAVM
jgi:outer membrane protein assembly factor BamD (BamD/ComL family)